MKQITIAGNVGKDAELRTTQGGKNVTGWTVAVDDGWGENKRTLWFDCNWWGARGEKVQPHIRKGGKVAVTGSLSTREHNGKTYLTIDVSDVTLQGGNPPQQHDSGYNAGGTPGGRDLDDEIPFAPEVRA